MSHILLMHELGSVIQNLLADDQVIEVMVNPDGLIWADCFGTGRRCTEQRLSVLAREGVVKLVASMVGQEVHEARPSVDAQLEQSKARFHGWLGCISAGPGFTIRKRAQRIFTLNDYVASKVMTEEQASALRAAVAGRENILVVGGTGSGKTTLANAVLEEVARSGDRVLTIEDVAELQCATPDLVPMYTRVETGYDMRRAIQDALRKRPDRIIVGEVREGGAALELLKAWNTGHPGGVATLHANSAQAALGRLEDLLAEISPQTPYRLIAEAVHWVVFIAREGSSRKLRGMVQVCGWSREQGYELKDFGGAVVT